MSVYLFSNAILPKTTVLRIEQLFWSFLWGSRPGGGRGVHLVAWDVVCQHQWEGGLGTQSFVARWEALIAWHATRFILHPDSTWSTMMRVRYDTWTIRGEIQISRRASIM